jgi:ketosteroid isomerase-like protein
MSPEQNVQRIRHAFEAWNRRGPDGIIDFLDEGIEFFPNELDHAIRGKAGVRRYFDEWLEVWEGFSAELQEVVDAGNDLFVAARLRARAKGSGVEVDMHYFASFTVREGKSTRWVEHLDRSEALEAVGLPEETHT